MINFSVREMKNNSFWHPGTLALNSIALRKAKIVCNFGLSECNRVKGKYSNSPLD